MSIQENEVLDFLTELNFSMSDYQIQNFVLRSQVTSYRQIHQCLMELNSRKEGILQTEVDQKRREIKKRKIERDLETETDDLEKELLQIDLEEVEKDLKYVQKRLNLQKREYELFLNIITSQFGSKEELQNYMNDPEQERKYWIARMGKQAAIDLLATGRIGTGNMDSIAMMSEDDQVQTIKVAIQYSSLMGVGITKIQEEMSPYLKKLADTSDKILPTFDGIENNLNIDLAHRLGYEKKSIQSSNQSEDL